MHKSKHLTHVATVYVHTVCTYIGSRLPKEVQKLNAHKFPATVSSHDDKIDLSFLLRTSGMHIICTFV